MKKIALSVAAAVLALAMTGCTFTSTVTKTETVTDANGKTTTRTTTTTNDNGKVTTSETVEVVEATEATEAAETAEATEAQGENIVATIAFENNSGVLIYGLYFSSALNDTWGDNILDGSNPLSDGYTATCENALTYSSGNVMWDLRIADSDGNTADFKGLDLSKAADPHNITIVLNYDAEENSYYANVK